MRDHTKSRRGCQQCKRRKVKCDEKLPCCTRCHRRREQCSYLQDYASRSPSAPATPASGDGQPSAEAGLPSSYLINLELTHVYLTDTYKTLWGRRDGQLLWRDVIFRNALRYPALLNGLFAMSAMHLITRSHDPEEQNRYASIALQKQTAAIEGFVPLLHSFNDETAEVVFPMSMLVSYWGFASRRLPPQLSILSTNSDLKLASHADTPSAPATSAITQFLELIRRLRGMHEVHQTTPSVLHGILAPLTDSPKLDEIPELPEDTRDALATLRRHVDAVPGIVSTFHEEHYILSLEYIFRVALCSEFLELVVGWPVRVPEALISEIRAGNNAALTILAYWAACFHSMNDRWWAEGWSTTLILEVVGLVREPWRSLLDWPRGHVGLSLA